MDAHVMHVYKSLVLSMILDIICIYHVQNFVYFLLYSYTYM